MNRPKKTKIFRRYKNIGGSSKVLRFMIEQDSITIDFLDNTCYRWTNQSAGPDSIAKMKSLALAGKGLDSYIKSNVAERFLRKVR
jgi:hypothetical protein